MDRGDHDVEPAQQVVVVVEDAVGADFQLAAVQQPESFGRRLRWRGPVSLLPLEAGVQLGDDLALLLDPIRREPLAMARDCEWSVRTWKA